MTSASRLSPLEQLLREAQNPSAGNGALAGMAAPAPLPRPTPGSAAAQPVAGGVEPPAPEATVTGDSPSAAPVTNANSPRFSPVAALPAAGSIARVPRADAPPAAAGGAAVTHGFQNLAPVADDGRLCGDCPSLGFSLIPATVHAGAAAGVAGLGAFGGSSPPLFSSLMPAETLLLHSRPTASKRIFLDFDGYTMASSIWEYGAAMQVSAYQPKTDLYTEIQQIWKTLAEYFSPFDVDVTTQEPRSNRLSNTGGSDSEWGIRAVFAANPTNLLTNERIRAVVPNVGGQALRYSFSASVDEPALIFATTGSYDAAVIAAHEIGHTLGLSHQGTSTAEYYPGHGGSGVTSWGAIMGAPYVDGIRENLITWSNGSYYNADSTEDQLAAITTYNGFGYRPDDVGDTLAAAKPLGGVGFRQFGVIERNTDVDFYSFVTGPGSISLRIDNAVQAWIATGGSGGDPYLNQTYGDRLLTPYLSSLDIAAKLYDVNGTLIATSNPIDSLGASFDLDLPAGRYFLGLDGVGYGNPLASTPTGYSDYGILGQYVISGLLQDVNGLRISAPTPLVTSESGGAASFQVALTSQPTSWVRIDVSSDHPEEGRPRSGSLLFNPGDWNIPQTVIIKGEDDAIQDGPVAYNIVLDPSQSAAPEYSVLAPRKLAARNDDNDIPSLSLSGPATAALEGMASSFKFLLRLDRASPVPVSLSFLTIDGTATAGADYAAINRTLVIPAGQTQLEVPISLINNSVAEPDESFSVSISAVTNASISGPAQVTAWITDALISAKTTTLPNGVDVLRLSGSDAINGTGNSGPNQIVGNASSNVLKGGGGLDVLTGMAGLDSFDLTGISTSSNAETITDFVTGVGGEKMLLSNNLTSRSGNGTPALRTITSLGASTLILETGSKSSSPGFDLFLVNAAITDAQVDLASSSDGTPLLDGLYSGVGAVNLKTSTSAGQGYLGAYDNDNFYLYWFSAGSHDTMVSSGEIQLVGVLDSSSAIAPDALVASNFQLI